MKNIKYIEEVKLKGNFWFMETINKEIYEKLLAAEKLARINFRECGSLTRAVLETIIGAIISEHNLGKKIPNNMKLFEKIEALRDESILPVMGRVKVVYENGDIQDLGFYDFFRRLGNAASHPDIRPTDVKLDYKHIFKALKGYHTFLTRYYRRRVPKQAPNFMEDLMPIERHYIEASYVPSDTETSKCIREFVSYTLDARGDKMFYGILRLYNKDDLNEKFILRNTDTFIEASKVSMSGVPEGMTTMREITPYNNPNSSFYIVAYMFNRKPERLTERLLKSIDLHKRIRMCKRIADCFYNLHRLESPIYHRLLSDESIYVCDFGKEWVPYVIKFDFAKIESGSRGTVRKNTDDAIDALKDLKQIKYLALECVNIDDDVKVNWEKIDIYSLGILFADIIGAQIMERPVSFESLAMIRGLPKNLLDLIDFMIADSPEERADIDIVTSILNEEVAKLS